MYRALNVDLIASMQEIVDEVVFYYKADFDYDGTKCVSRICAQREIFLY